jgi:arsenate reductase
VSRFAKRVLFVCLGNSCRSQMAEGFARAYGSDVIIPASAGFTPASRVAPDTIRAMSQKGINLKDHFPKGIQHLGRAQFDVVINMSAFAIPEKLCADIRTWDVEDPVYMDFEDHCTVRDEIERLVMLLILELRKEQNSPHLRPTGLGR